MNFSDLEKIMAEKGIASLAEIARVLSTTPQAVSNWKSRDQIPYHVAVKLNQSSPLIADKPQASDQSPVFSAPTIFEEETISFSDILLTMAEQLKVIILVPFIAIFLTFTYVQFIQQPKYISSATVLLPDNKVGNLSGIAGIASQFGVNVPMPTGASADLSSPSLFPELLRSRIFAEKILDKSFYLEEHGKELSLLAILTHGDNPPKVGRDTLVTSALSSLRDILQFEQNSNTFSVIRVTVSEPIFAKELAEATLFELESLNRFFKSQMINEKTTFINQRIAAVKSDLESSEQALKAFNEQNRQISSPSLQLEQERFARDVEVQKGVYLTLKQQLELAKIEEVQEASIVQVLDSPQTPLSPANKDLKGNVLLAGVLGLILGIILGFVRSYLDSSDINERKKLRRVKHFFKKKLKDIIFDRRVSGIVNILMIIGLPFYLGSESKKPVFFGMYSSKLMLVNTAYVIILLSSISLFIYLTKKSKN
tara:strand:- start:891 stop:2336 length:1446 start_codon:yes stop_codon:yes gene_type:complete